MTFFTATTGAIFWVIALFLSLIPAWAWDVYKQYCEVKAQIEDAHASARRLTKEVEENETRLSETT